MPDNSPEGRPLLPGGLVAFVEARLADDEAAARAAAAGGRWRYCPSDDIGAWTLYDEHWTIASLKTYRHEEFDYAARMPALRHPGYVDADANGRHIVRHDPSRVLREVEAKRRIVARYAYRLSMADDSPDDLTRHYYEVVRDLAAAWSDHPDHRDDWGTA